MAGETEPDKAALLAEIAAARARLVETGEGLRAAFEDVRHKLDVPTRAKESFQENKPAWIGGAALVGLLLSKIPARKKTVLVERGLGLAAGGKLAMLWGAAKFAATLAKPFIGDITGERIHELVGRFSKKIPRTEPRGKQEPS
jgi:hypothetical protein